MNVKDLSKQLILDSSSLTGYLDRLETRGLVHRQDDPEDRRGVRVFLTAQGWSLKNQLEPIGRELKHTLEQGVPHGKVEAFAQALRHIHDRLG